MPTWSIDEITSDKPPRLTIEVGELKCSAAEAAQALAKLLYVYDPEREVVDVAELTQAVEEWQARVREWRRKPVELGTWGINPEATVVQGEC